MDVCRFVVRKPLATNLGQERVMHDLDEPDYPGHEQRRCYVGKQHDFRKLGRQEFILQMVPFRAAAYVTHSR
jgi:hypothetical protein